MIVIPEYIEALKPYIPGKPIHELKRERGLTKIVKLASNENPLGPSPKALEVIEKHLQDLHYYPDAKAYDLVTALSKKYDRKSQEIICGNGIDSLLGYIIQAFSNKDDEILTCNGTFIGLYVNVRKFGRKLRLLPLIQYGFDFSLLLKNISQDTKIIYLANPNNPTGTQFTIDEFEYFMSKVPSHILVILDEAYFSYARSNLHYPNGTKYELDNLIVLRTFSKDYGLAGLRIGFGIGPEKLISELYKVKLPFEPSRLAEQAAVAALEETEYLQKSIHMTQQSLTRMISKFQKLGITFVPPTANFMMILMPSETQAELFYQKCLNEGLILRHLPSFGIPEGIRINSANEEDTTFALDIIERTYRNFK